MGAVVEKFTIPDAADILDIENGRLREWVSREYIKPDFPSEGRGSRHRLTRWNLYQIELFVYLLRRGLARKLASAIVRNYTPHDLITRSMEQGSSPQQKEFVCVYRTDDSLDHEWYGGSESIPLKHHYQDLYVVNVSRIRQQVDERLAGAETA
jgi:hypothetical protein